MKTVEIKVSGESIQARAGGCAGGVCGACVITVRSPEGQMTGTDLACMCPVEEGMEIFPCPVDSVLPVKPEPNPTTEKLRIAYPTLDRCTKCGSCTTACPMSIPVMDSVLRMKSGQLDKVAEDFATCIHCGLCRFVCEDGVKPHMMAMWVRRSIGSSTEQGKDKNLELESEQVDLEWKYLLNGNSTVRMNHARQFRKSGKI